MIRLKYIHTYYPPPMIRINTYEVILLPIMSRTKIDLSFKCFVFYKHNDNPTGYYNDVNALTYITCLSVVQVWGEGGGGKGWRAFFGIA